MHNELFSVGPFTVYGYGLMIAIGAMSAIALSVWRAGKRGLNKDHVFNVCLFSLLAGLIGAKLTYLLGHFSLLLEDPLEALSTEGFVVYGGVIVGILVGLLLCKHYKLPFGDMMDTLIPTVAMAQGFGRIGCFLAGCCYGAPTDSVFGVVFPEGSSAPAGIPLWPTQLLSSAGDFLIFAILLLVEKKGVPRTVPAALYLGLYGIGRFFIEFLRADTRTYFFGLSSNQWVSFVFLGVCIALVVSAYKKQKNDGAPPEIPPEAE